MDCQLARNQPMAAILPLRSAIEKLQAAAATGAGDKAGGGRGGGGGGGSSSEQQLLRGQGHLTPLHGDFLQVIVLHPCRWAVKFRR